MKRSLFLFAALAVAASAWATGNHNQTASSSLVNSGSISNTVKTNASVVGMGTSYSNATGAAGASAAGTSMTAINPVCNGACGAKSGAAELTGAVSTYNNGSAFNVSTGAGTGSASSVGQAQAALDTKASYAGPGQSLSIAGDAHAASAIGVVAGPNTGGAASASNVANFTVEGAVGSKSCTGVGTPCGTQTNKEVWGNVADTKNATSTAATGNMTVDGVTLAPANTSATANAVVNASGKFSDPI